MPFYFVCRKAIGEKMGKRVLVTGGSGFIGRNLVEQLSKKNEISAPGHSELDLSDQRAVESYLKGKDFDVIVHAAGVGVSRRNAGMPDMLGMNLRQFFNIERCSGMFGRLIQLGSGAEYDKSRPLVKVKETEFGKRVPLDDYGFFKYICSRRIESMDNAVCLRIFGCYGKYEDYGTRFISNAICNAILGLPITINNRNVFFSYLYVNDLALVIDRFIQKEPKQKFYNVAPEKAVDLLAIAKKVIGVSGKDLEIDVKNNGLGPEYSADSSRLKKELPDFKFTRIEAGIKELYKWYEENKNTIDRSRLEARGS